MGPSDVTTKPLPFVRENGLLVEEVGDETVVYDLDTKDVHCLAPLAATVFHYCDGRTTPAQCATAISEKLGSHTDEDAVLDVVAQFEERGFFRSPMLTVHNENDGYSRRDFARRSAVAGAAVFAAPLITSIVAPTAAMAASGIATGCAGCGKNPDCASNHCCQSVPGKQCRQGCCV